MPDSVPKFFNPENPPTPGGWHFWLEPTTKQHLVQGAGPEDLLSQIRRYQQNNGKYQGDEPIVRAMWGFWCSREPSRCVASTPSAQVGRPADGGVPKEVWGPILWQALNWLAVKYEQQLFDAFVARMRYGQLIPCPDCKAHFEEICLEDSPLNISTQKAACLWSWRVHNTISRALNKPQFSYADAVTNFGFPPQ